MPQTCISTVDPLRHTPLPVVVPSNVIWSSGTQVWDGLTVELHRFDELDMPEFAIPDYSLIVQTSPAIKVESKVGGTFEERLAGPETSAYFPPERRDRPAPGSRSKFW